MSETPQPARLVKSAAPDPIWTRLSVVWIVPLLALLITLGVAWKTYADRGVLIEITFADATGITPGQTALRFREVEVGRVELVGFAPDLSSVLVNVRVQKDVAAYIDAEAQFWIVRPEVTAQGISRLDTVLSGVFIEGWWDAQPGPAVQRFTGLERAPLGLGKDAGTWIVLRSDDAGGLANGAPVIFRGVAVGQLQNLRLSEGDGGVLADAFIRAPHDQRLSSATVFWNTSGFSVSLGAQGVKLDVRSLSSLVQGGVEFSTPVSGGQVVEPGHEFRLFADEGSATDSVFSDSLAAPVRLMLVLDDAPRGLNRGAAVLYQALPVGEVTDLSLRIDTEADGTRRVRQQVVIALNPERLGLEPGADEEATLAFLAERVDAGLHARLTSTGLLRSTLAIELLDLPDEPAGVLDLAALPHPELPVAPADVSDFSATAEGMFSRINALPVEEVLNSAIAMMDSVTGFVGRDDTQAAPAAVIALLDEMHALVASDDVQAVPGSLRASLAQAEALLTELRDGGMSEKTLSAVDEVTRAAAAFSTATEGLPELIASLDQLAQTVNDVPLAELAGEAADVLGEIERFLGLDGTAALPERIGATLDEMTVLLASLREAGAAENLNATLAAAQTAADALAEASAGLPALSTRLEAVLGRIDALVLAYGDRSAFNVEILSVLRELRGASAAVGSLAQTIERNPRALLFGR